MRKVWALALTAAIAAATLVVAAPSAHAWPADCAALEDPPGVSVDPDTLQVRIDPGGLPNPDADWALQVANCLDNGLVLNKAFCFALMPLWFPFGEHVYQDPYTGEIVIDGGRLASDATTCLYR